MQPTLRLTNVSKRFGGVAALDNVSFEVRPGEIHALLGENGAGKSTLMAISAGSLQPDEGVIEVLGQVVGSLNPLVTHRMGISIVYQHPALAPDLTVIENLAMALPDHVRRYDHATKELVAQQLLGVGFHASIFERVSELNVVERQLLEIAKALMAQPKILILDEPTAALGARETDMLFDRVRHLAATGVSIIYITHRLVEVRALCDTVSILRDGEGKGSYQVVDISDTEILQRIVGSNVTSEFPPKHVGDTAQKVLEVQGLSGRSFRDIHFDSLAGEIVGIGGIVGNGQTHLLRALAGMERSAGQVYLNGAVHKLSNSAAALGSGVVYLSSDRLKEGLFTSMSIRENSAISSLKMFSRAGVVNRRPEAAAVKAEGAALALKAKSIESNVLSLSGGNQQKVLFARALLNPNMKVLLADEPTQGVDVGARAEIYKILRRIADSGVAVVVVSSDVRELNGLCDRVVVMSSGKKVNEFASGDISQEGITRAILTATAHDEEAEIEEKDRSLGFRAKSTRFIRGDFGASAVLAILMLLIAGYTDHHSPRFLHAFNLNGLFLLIAELGFIAIGESFVIMTGGIDLSVGPLAGLIAVIGSVFETNSKNPSGIILGFVVIVIVALAVGLINGLLVLSKIFTPVAATLVSYIGLQGASLLIRPQPAGYISYTVMNFIQAGWLNVPYALMLLIVLAISLDYGLRRRRWGRRLRATGSDYLAAFRLGAKPGYTLVRAYMASSLFAAFGGIMLMAQIGVGDATQGVNFTLTAVTAVVLGGTSVFGGRGTFVGVVLGSGLIMELLNITVFLNLSESYQYWFQGTLIFVAVGIYAYARKSSTEGQSIFRRRIKAVSP
jgi:ribose transport system ATP-binding protein